MKTAVMFLATGCVALACASCKPDPTGGKSLSESKANHKTVLRIEARSGEPVEEPPKNVFKTIQYNAAPGKMWAYLTPDPKDKKKHPAIVWITGGDCNTIGDVWTEADADNEQTASAYRGSVSLHL